MSATNLKPLFLATALIEIGAGLCLLLLPALSLALLLGLDHSSVETNFIGRFAGAALLALGVASWMMRHEKNGAAQLGFITGMSVYNTVAAILFAYAGIVLKMVGFLLWPVVGLHAIMAVWCLICFRGHPKL